MSAQVFNSGIGVCCRQKIPNVKVDGSRTLIDIMKVDYKDFRIAMLDASERDELPSEYCPSHCRDGIELKDLHADNLKTEIINGNSDVYFPIDISLTLDHVCNIKCKMCWIYDDLDYKINETFVIETIDYLSEYTDTECALSLLGGEPQYSIYEQTIIRYAIDKNVPVSFISNFSIFNADMFNSIPIGNLRSVNISANAASNETRKRIMGDSFDRFYKNIEDFFKLKEKRDLLGDYSYITLSFIIMTSNYHELIKAIDLYLHFNLKLMFVPILYKLEGSYEELYNIKTLQHGASIKLNEAIEYLDNMLDGDNLKTPSSNYDTDTLKVECINFTKDSLTHNVNYLNTFIENGVGYDKPLFDIEIKNKKAHKIKLI